MTNLFAAATSEFAERTSREGFLARGGKVLLGVVGVGALTGAVAGVGRAGTLACSYVCTCCAPCRYKKTGPAGCFGCTNFSC